MAALGWFVSTVTQLTRVRTKKEAMALQDSLQARGLDAGVLLRECSCGCGEPASKATPRGRV